MKHPNFESVTINRINDEPQKWLNLFNARYRREGKSGAWQFASRNAHPKLKPHNAAVIIVALVRTTKGPRLLASAEFRVPIGGKEYGFNAGLIDQNETPEHAAARELWEESGLTLTKAVFTSPPIVSSAGLSDEAVTMCFVEAEGELNKRGQEPGEDINCFLLDEAGVCRLADRKGRFKGAVIAAKAWPVLFMFRLFINLGISLEDAFKIMAGGGVRPGAKDRPNRRRSGE